MLGRCFVDYYGSQTPLSKLANKCTRCRTITIQPFEKYVVLKKAVWFANLGFNQ
jgi:ribosome recycling factor